MPILAIANLRGTETTGAELTGAKLPALYSDRAVAG